MVKRTGAEWDQFWLDQFTAYGKVMRFLTLVVAFPLWVIAVMLRQAYVIVENYPAEEGKDG